MHQKRSKKLIKHSMDLYGLHPENAIAKTPDPVILRRTNLKPLYTRLSYFKLDKASLILLCFPKNARLAKQSHRIRAVVKIATCLLTLQLSKEDIPHRTSPKGFFPIQQQY